MITINRKRCAKRAWVLRRFADVRAQWAAVAISCAWSSCATAAESTLLGSGDPGLKVATRGTDAIVIYRDEPKTVGVGLVGGMLERHIEVLVDRDYHFRQDRMEIPSQLYPLDATSAFTSEGGSWSKGFKQWEYTPRESLGWRLEDGRLTTIAHVQKVAEERYRLARNEAFLGFIDNRIFYWRDFNPARVYWRDVKTDTVYSIGLPRGVIDMYGVTKGIRKDVGVVVFRKSPGIFHYSPYTTDFIEISFDRGAASHTR